DVVAQCIPPDVDHLVRVVRCWDAPAVGPIPGPGDAEVLQATTNERQHLALVEFRDDPQPAARDQRLELVLVARETEEPVLLRDPLWNRLVLRAAAGVELVGRIELFAADAVEALVPCSVDVACGCARAPEPRNGRLVATICAGTDEVVKCQLEGDVQAGELRRVRRQQLGGGGDFCPGRRPAFSTGVVVAPGATAP